MDEVTLVHKITDDIRKMFVDIVTDNAIANGIDPDHVDWLNIQMADDMIIAPVTSGPKKGTLRIKCERRQ